MCAMKTEGGLLGKKEGTNGKAREGNGIIEPKYMIQIYENAIMKLL